MLNIYKIPNEKIRDAKKVLEAQDKIETTPEGETKKEINYWARNGYTLRDAKSLGLDKECSYLYVDGPDEFFEQNEKQITEVEGIEKLAGEEYEEVKSKVEEEQSGAAEGIGSIFG